MNREGTKGGREEEIIYPRRDTKRSGVGAWWGIGWLEHSGRHGLVAHATGEEGIDGRGFVARGSGLCILNCMGRVPMPRFCVSIREDSWLFVDSLLGGCLWVL